RSRLLPPLPSFPTRRSSDLFLFEPIIDSMPGLHFLKPFIRYFTQHIYPHPGIFSPFCIVRGTCIYRQRVKRFPILHKFMEGFDSNTKDLGGIPNLIVGYQLVKNIESGIFYAFCSQWPCELLATL